MFDASLGEPPSVDPGGPRFAVELTPTGVRVGSEDPFPWSESLALAERALLRAVELAGDSDFELWLLLGSVYAGLDDDDEAERCYRRALELEPVQAQIWFALGVLYQDHRTSKLHGQSEFERSYQQALEHFAAAIEVGGDNAELIADAQNRVAEIEDALQQRVCFPEAEELVVWPEDLVEEQARRARLLRLEAEALPPSP